MRQFHVAAVGLLVACSSALLSADELKSQSAVVQAYLGG